MICLATSISLSGLVPLLIQLVIAGLIFWLLMWFLGVCGLPEPFNKVAKILIALVVLIYVLNLLMGLSGNAFITR